MTKTFADLQASFQHAILERDGAVLADLMQGPRESRDAMLGVYQHAYGSRLIEAIGKDHELLHAYLGDDTFRDMAEGYLAKYPSTHPSVRWISRKVPDFLGEAEPFCDYPVVRELALLEKSLNDAFDAPDGAVLTGADLGAIAPEAWHDLIFSPHPTACRLTFTTNAAVLWSALREDAEVPAAEELAEPQHLIIWRHDTTPMFRPLSTEEAMMWDEAVAGIPFGQLCTMLATFDDPDGAAGRAASYLGGWVSSGMLSAATPS